MTVGYSHLVTGEVSEIRENPAGSNTLLAEFDYDDLGRRTLLTRGNGASTSYAYDDVSRLDELALGFSGTSHDLTLGFSYNPAGQIAANERSNDAFAFSGLANANVADTINGLNQVTATGGTSVSYGDGRGNITAIGSTSYGYRADNLMTSAGSATMTYSLGRLFQVTSGGSTTQFGYDGFSLIAEYDPAAVPSNGGIAPALRPRAGGRRAFNVGNLLLRCPTMQHRFYPTPPAGTAGGRGAKVQDFSPSGKLKLRNFRSSRAAPRP